MDIQLERCYDYYAWSFMEKYAFHAESLGCGQGLVASIEDA